MGWLISTKQYIPAVIGEPWGGGYFAGYISHTADGNPTHALIVAPRATGATGEGYPTSTRLAWKTSLTSTPGTTSTFDGRSNTNAIITAGIGDHPAAQFCVNLNINGYSDWYLPAPDELDIAYFNLKPSTSSNYLSDGPRGVNPYAVPKRDSLWSASYPAKTTVTKFLDNTEGFSTAGTFGSAHLSSQQSSSSSVTVYFFTSGRYFGSVGKTDSTNYGTVRAFRRITL